MDPLWGQFLLSAAGVIAAGILIGRVSGEVGDRLKLGRAWSGAVLLALATTLPELVATITVALRGEPAMALGGVLGSIIFNLFIFVFIDLFERKPIYPQLSSNHMATGLLGCLLLGVAIAGMSFGYGGIGGSKGIGIGHVGITSLVILALYLLGQVVLFRLAKGSYKSAVKLRPTGIAHWPLGRVLASYGALAGVILVAAYNLGVSADQLAARYELGPTFAGVALLGVVTSLPEVTNALACAKRRDYDLAAGNILGANVFVFLAVVLADLCTLKGRLFNELMPTEAVSSIAMAGMAIVMTSVVLGALAIRSADKIGRLSIASILLAFFFVASLVIAYRFASPY